MKKRHTIALCLEYPLGQMGGMELLVQRLVLDLPDAFDLILVSTDLNLRELPLLLQNRLKAHFYWNARTISPKNSQLLVENLRHAGVDLVHFHLGGNYSWETHKFWHSPVYFCGREKLPHLLTTHKSFSVFEGYCNPARHVLVRALLFPKAWLSRAIVLWSTPLEITVSKYDEKAMQRLFPPWRKRFRHLYHSRLSLADSQETMSTATREKVIICAGTFGLIKGQHVLVRAFTRLASRFPEWTLELIGRRDGSAYQKELEQIAGPLLHSKQIRFGGVISDFKGLRTRLGTVGIYVQPSLVEGLPLAVQEALFFGCPVISSDVGGIPEMIKSGKNGLLVPPGDEEALTVALEQLIQDEALRHRLGKAARGEILSLHMTREDMVSQYIEIYNDLISKG